MGPEGTVSALAVSGDEIVWAGDAADAERWIGPQTHVVELNGRTVVPGFADAHIHLESLGRSLVDVDLVGSRSYAEVIERIVARAAELPEGTWITGRGWDQNDWPEAVFPHHEALSRALPHHPVVMRRIGGHALLANAAALEAAGIDRKTVAPEGGHIHVDDSGAPTGVLVDNAMSLMGRVMPPTSREDRRRHVRAAVDHLHARGVTAVHDAGIPASSIDLYDDMARAGELPLRVAVMVAASEPELLDPQSEREWPTDDLTGDGLISVRAIKLSVDGALGSRGAALIEPYSDAPQTRGLVLVPEARTRQLVRFALEGDWQLCVHAIGDGANRQVLDLFAAGLDAQPVDDHRFRIEHAQVLQPDDLSRFAELGVIPSMQAQHQTSDMPWAEERLGPERITGAYAWRALLDTGVIIAGGSDAPVEQVDVAAVLHASVTRRDLDDHPIDGWYPDQAMTQEEALLSVTRWAAEASFWEDRIGSLVVGKQADLVVLSLDPLACEPEQLKGMAVELTVFDGDVVFPLQSLAASRPE